jgi:hypothetical protein
VIHPYGRLPRTSVHGRVRTSGKRMGSPRIHVTAASTEAPINAPISGLAARRTTNPSADRTKGRRCSSTDASSEKRRRRSEADPWPTTTPPSERVAITVVARPPRSLQAKSVVPATAGDLIRSRRQKSDARAAADLTAPRVGSELVCWTDRRRLRRCRRGGARRRSTPGASWIDSMPQLASRGRRSQRLRPRGPRFFPDGAAAGMRPERSPRARWSE